MPSSHDAAAAQPDKFSLYHRPDNAEGDTWAPTSHQADHLVAGDGDGAVVFQPDITLPGSGQLIIRQSGLVGTIQLPLPQQFVVYPNPLRSGEPLQVAVSLPSTAYAIALFDANGKLAWQSIGNGASTFEGLSLGAGVYYYQITSPALICTGRLVVVGGPD